MTELPPIRRQVVVPGTRAAAFDVFTSEIGTWWPLERHSVYGEGTSVRFTDDRLVERGPDGDEAVWGKVLYWRPPETFRITWHPSSDPANSGEVTVSFAEVTGGLTLVTLEHSGWERYPDPTTTHTQYSQGWPRVLDRFVGHLPPAGQPGEGRPVWLALMHTAGAALPAGESVFAQPDFAEHIAFLRRLDERGVLVAAGSLDGNANGMTVIRVPDASEVPAYVQLAQAEDQSVVRGLLLVRVRPWQVALEGTNT